MQWSGFSPLHIDHQAPDDYMCPILMTQNVYLTLLFSHLWNLVEPARISETCPSGLTLVCCHYTLGGRTCFKAVSCDAPDEFWQCCRREKPSVWVDCEDLYSDEYENEEYPADDGSYLPPHDDEPDWNWFKSVPFGIPGDAGPAWDFLRQLLTEDNTSPLNAKSPPPLPTPSP